MESREPIRDLDEIIEKLMDAKTSYVYNSILYSQYREAVHKEKTVEELLVINKDVEDQKKRTQKAFANAYQSLSHLAGKYHPELFNMVLAAANSD